MISFNDDNFTAVDIRKAGNPPPIGYTLEINHDFSNILDFCALYGDVKLNDDRWTMVMSEEFNP